MIGRTLSHYRILEKLGSGGMGDVYLAQDTELKRDVALKVLPPELAENEERRARFNREARTVAALNHPNIVTVYSVEEAEGIHFITMELVRGKTLSERIPKGGLSLERFFKIAIPLADAVAVAHDHGIIHRDLKPANVMLTEDGRVKVLDFGLAKPTAGLSSGDGAASELPTAARTTEGVIVGTASYMSPEQTEGKTIDPRSDIFSLGVVLYELATGQRPFRGDSATAVLSSILKDTPVSVMELKPELPSELSKIVRRCLVKDPEHRYQSAKDVRNEIEELKQEMDSGSLVASQRPTEVRRSGPVIAVLGLAVVSVVFAAWFLSRPRTRSVPRLVHPVQLTSAIGVEDHPTWSPDGRMIAYESQQSGNWDLWVTQAEKGQPVNRTADFPGLDRRPSWHPDGSAIAFVSEREGGGCFVSPAVGGEPRRRQATRRFNSVPQWSSDGQEIACLVREDPGTDLDIRNVSTQEVRRLRFSGLIDTPFDLSWSPDGRFFAYVDAVDDASDVTFVRVLRMADGQSYPMTDGRTKDRSPSWSADARALYYVSNRGGSMDLWQQSLTADGEPEGAPRPVTVGIDMRSAVFSPDGAMLAYSRGRPVANLWRVSILPGRPATWKDATQLTFDQVTVEFMDESPDGKWIAVNSDRKGNHDVWILPVEGGDMRQLTLDPTPEWKPTWSPDGKYLAFYAYRNGNRDIWIMPAEGGAWRQVTRDESDEYNERWSPDGLSLVFQKNRDIWKISVDGTEEVQLTVDRAIDARPDWSPDGKWIVFDSDRTGSRRLWRVQAEGGDAEPLTKGPGLRPFFSNDGRRVFFEGDGERNREFLGAFSGGRGGAPCDRSSWKAGGTSSPFRLSRREIALLHLERGPRRHLGHGCRSMIDRIPTPGSSRRLAEEG